MLAGGGTVSTQVGAIHWPQPAIDVFHWAVHSASPAFVWANETKIACAKAIGYLKLGHFRREIDVETIQKCECFHARMVWYMGRRTAISR